MRLLALLVLLLTVSVHAQIQEKALSSTEVEVLRETADDPPARTLAFVTFLNDRASAIDKLMAGKRRPGREEDLHDEMEQFTAIAGDLGDNLDEYGTRHYDIRKSLPKLLAATERWATTLKSPPENDTYKLLRTLALDAVADLHEQTVKLIADQKAYFLAHPPGKPGSSPEHP